MSEIEDRIEASSLGTPEAKAARESVSDETAARIVERSWQIEAEDLRAQIHDLLEEREELLTEIRRLRMGNHPAGRALRVAPSWSQPPDLAVDLAEALTERDAEHDEGRVVSMDDTLPLVLDPAPGSRMFYFDPADDRVLFGDIRSETHTLCDGRALEVSPDATMDFRRLPFADATFRVVIFDPPHLVRVGRKSWMFKKYGGLNVTTWPEDLAAGFAECFRVLAVNGVLIFKWNSIQIPVSEVLALTPHRPLVGHRRVGKSADTHWITFLKTEETP